MLKTEDPDDAQAMDAESNGGGEVMGEMRIMNQKGDIAVEWDADDPESVKKANEEFKRLKKDGYEFFEAVETKGKRLDRFNKKLGKVIAVPGVKKAEDKKTGKRGKAMAGGPNSRLVR